MAEVKGQVETQPALTQLNPHEAVQLIAEMIEKSDSGEQPRDDSGKFIKAEAEAKATPEKPETVPEEPQAEAPKPEDEQPEITPEPRRFRLKYKGEELEKEEPEVIALAQQGFDYTQKSQALAKEKEELGLKIKTEVEQRQKLYEDQMEVYKQAVLKLADPEAMGADLSKIAETDPVKAQKLFFKRIEINQALQAVQAEQQKIAQTRQFELQQQMRKQANDAIELLPTKISGWNNDLYGKILKAGIDEYGFKPDEVNAITDPRAIQVLNDARQWREYQAAKPKSMEKRIAAVPKVSKPGTTEKADPNASKLKESMARLDKSGTRGDAVDVVRQLIESGKL